MIHKSASVMTSKLPHLGKRVCLIMLWSILGVSLKFVEFESNWNPQVEKVIIA